MLHFYNFLVSYNHLTSNDYNIIIANHLYYFKEQFLCNSSSKFKKFKNPEKQAEISKKINFCIGEPSPQRISYNHIYKNIDFRVCPCRFLDNSIEILASYSKIFEEIGYIHINEERVDFCNISNVLHESLIVISNLRKEEEHERQKKEIERIKQKR